MSFNGSGQFQLNSGGLPYVTGTTISSTTANNLNTDLASGLSNVICKDGQTTVTANLPMSTFRHTNVGVATARTDYARASQVQDSSLVYVGSVAGTNTVTGSLAPAITAYATGQLYGLIPANTNTGATTVNINSVGAANIFRNGLALVGGELKKGQPTQLQYDGTNFNIVSTGSSLVQRDIPYFLQGLTYSNNVADATNDIDIAAGVATDSTGVYLMRLGSSITKRLDAAWTVGTNQGGLDTGAIGNSDYYIHLIARSDTGVVDALFSLSPTAPTMPANYDYRRLIGWFKRVGATIVAFHSYEESGGGLFYQWDSPTLDINLANTLTTSRRLDAVKVPLDFGVDALLNISLADASSFLAWVYSPDQADLAPSASLAPLANEFSSSVTGSAFNQLRIRTNASGQIAARSDLATVNFYLVSTMGFYWARRN